jgi:hypothetical protein
MTAIVGLVQDRRVWMAGDSSANDTDSLYSTSREQSKVFRNGQYLVGVSGQTRCAQVMRYVLIPPIMPAHIKGIDEIVEFMVREFVPVLRTCLDEHGVTTGEVTDPFPGNALIGVRGNILEMEPDFQVESNTELFNAAGAASAYCLGAFHATRDLIDDPWTRIRTVLKAAAAYSMVVKAPFSVEVMEPDE